MENLGAQAVPALVQAMRDENLPYRADAVEHLGRLQDPRSTLALIESMLDEDIYLHVRNALKSLGEPAHQPLTFVAGKNEAPPVFQEKCIRLLSEMKVTSALDTLIAQTKSSESRIRMLCARVLGEFGDKAAKKCLMAIINKGESEVDEVVAAAMLSLGSLGDKKVFNTLNKGTAHFSSRVRGAAIIGLGNLGDSRAVPGLIDGLGDVKNDNRVLIIQALAKLHNQDAIPVLLSVLEESKIQSIAGTKGGYLGSYAIQALAELGEPSVVRLLLTDWEEELESAMGSLGVRAIPFLAEALRTDKDAHVRALAAEAMGVVQNNSAMGHLIVALQDEDDGVRQAAAWSLNHIYQEGGKTDPPVLSG